MRTPRQHVDGRTGETYWRVRYRKDEKQRALTFYGPNAERDAAQFCRLLDTLGPYGAVRWWNEHIDDEPTGPTVDEWWARYQRAATGITQGSRDQRQGIYDRVWKPAIGSMQLDAVTREHISAVINEWGEKRADSTIADYFIAIAACMRVAVMDGHIPKDPTRGVKLPRASDHEKTEKRFLTYEEWDRLYVALPERWRPFFAFLAGTGCRSGEAEALRVADIDIDAQTVRIVKSLKWSTKSSSREVGPTKTRKSRRTVSLPPEVVEELKPIIEGRAGDELLFPGDDGTELVHRKAWAVWKKAAKDAGVKPAPRVHDLRHSHVAWLIALGVPLPVIQARLGHENISTTIDDYGHILPDLQAAAAQAASVALRGSSPLALG